MRFPTEGLMAAFRKGSPITVTFPRSKGSQSFPNLMSCSFAFRMAERASASLEEVVIFRSLMRRPRFGGSPGLPWSSGGRGIFGFSFFSL